VTVSGRLSAIAVDPVNVNHLLCGASAGGIWESFTRGADWAPRTDFMATLTTGAIAFDPVNPSVVYAGTGEGNDYWYFGQGILRSADGGTTWTLLAGKPFTGQGFFAIIVDPANTPAPAGRDPGPRSHPRGRHLRRHLRDRRRVPVGRRRQDLDPGIRGDGLLGHQHAARRRPGRRSARGDNRRAAQIRRRRHDLGQPATGLQRAVELDPPGGQHLAEKPHGSVRLRRLREQAVPVAAPDGKTEAIDLLQASYDWYAAAAPDNAGQVYLGVKELFRVDLSADATAWTWTSMPSRSTPPARRPSTAPVTAGCSAHPTAVPPGSR
jgi:hypothetical protein